MRRSRHRVALATVVATLGCVGQGQPPLLEPIGDQVAFVGIELRIELRATDPDLDELRFSFHSSLPGLAQRAQVVTTGHQAAEFRWTPLGTDVGWHYFDFSVTDGRHTVTETIEIEVRASVGENGAPIFREPLGSGTTLDLAVRDCVEIRIVVEDPDSIEVELAEEEPRIEGAQLVQETGLTGRWTWCPTATQIAAKDRYGLVLSADDGENPKTLKNFLVVIRKPRPDCDGIPPVVTHVPEDEATLLDLTILADIEDDVGLKGEPLFYYSTTDPGSPPDVGAMVQTSMILLDGTTKSGTWGADVPSPVAHLSAGASRTLYYVIVAEDLDDGEEGCVTQAPAVGSFQMKVTNPGGSGGLGLCAACTADVQCGGAGDHCLYMGGTTHCFQACSSDANCPSGYYCSITQFTSIDGAKARQCIPDDYSCSTSSGPTCVDDAHEPDDGPTTARDVDAAVNLDLGPYVSQTNAICAWNEDWFKVYLYAGETLHVGLAFTQTSYKEDLDVLLYRGSTLLTRCLEGDTSGCDPDNGQSWTSNESFVWPVGTSGTHYVVVRGWNGSENLYDVCIGLSSVHCPPP
jgi:hypothetical protein